MGVWLFTNDSPKCFVCPLHSRPHMCILLPRGWMLNVQRLSWGRVRSKGLRVGVKRFSLARHSRVFTFILSGAVLPTRALCRLSMLVDLHHPGRQLRCGYAHFRTLFFMFHLHTTRVIPSFTRSNVARHDLVMVAVHLSPCTTRGSCTCEGITVWILWLRAIWFYLFRTLCILFFWFLTIVAFVICEGITVWILWLRATWFSLFRTLHNLLWLITLTNPWRTGALFGAKSPVLQCLYTCVSCCVTCIVYR
jgi:hypothetical protein